MSNNSLVMVNNLTENDLVIRQINYIPVIKKLIDDDNKELTFPETFYDYNLNFKIESVSRIIA